MSCGGKVCKVDNEVVAVSVLERHQWGYYASSRVFDKLIFDNSEFVTIL